RTRTGAPILTSVERGAVQATALAALSRRALVVDDVSELLREAATAVARALDADCVTIHELGGVDDEAVLRAEVGPPGQLGWTVVGDDVVLRGRGFRSTLGSRVRPNGRVWGVVSAFARRPEAFDRQDALVVESIANLLATAIDRKSAGDAYRSREERFAAGFESSLLGTLLVGPDGHLLEVNRAFGEMLGHDPAQGDARPLREPGADHQAVRAPRRPHRPGGAQRGEHPSARGRAAMLLRPGAGHHRPAPRRGGPGRGGAGAAKQ
ncbi:MAG: GAF domain-containing protein, partial [Chloroflexi bacterium]